LRQAIAAGAAEIKAYVIGDDQITEFVLSVGNLTSDEKDIILAGCLINYYK